jgi:hypothetical protein
MVERRAGPWHGVVMALFTWFFLGLLIGSDELRTYSLQHAGVEALVERGTFDVSGSSTPEFANVGDSFVVNGRRMAAKQPGQFTLGALPYAVISALGVRYSRDYVLAAALVTWLSSAAATASGVLALWLLLTRRLGFEPPAAARAALCYGLGTTCTAYASAAHHDVIASALLLWAIYVVETAAESPRYAVLAGCLLALVIDTSFLPAPITAVLSLYAVWRAGFVRVSAGFALGVLPLAAYNWHYFGEPWKQANIAGNYADTFFAPDAARFFEHLRFYLGFGPAGIWRFAPLAAAGAFGILAFPRRLGRLRAALLLALLAHLAYLLNIETSGYCMYGPRYLMPLEALCAIGVGRLFALSQRVFTLPLFLDALLLASCAINSVGALGGTMNCWQRTYAFADYIADPSQLMAAEFPLRPVCASALALLLALVALAHTPLWPIKLRAHGA